MKYGNTIAKIYIDLFDFSVPEIEQIFIWRTKGFGLIFFSLKLEVKE